MKDGGTELTFNGVIYEYKNLSLVYIVMITCKFSHLSHVIVCLKKIMMQ